MPEAHLGPGRGRGLHKTAPTRTHCSALQRKGRYRCEVVAGVTALLAGGRGAHRFYLGWRWGLFYLLRLRPLVAVVAEFACTGVIGVLAAIASPA